MVKIKIGATLPTGPYQNIQPEIEADAETYAEAIAEVMEQIERLNRMYGITPLERKSDGFVIHDTFTGEQVKYNEETHSYTTLDNLPLLSGSAYAKQFEKPFPKEMILPKMEAKYGVPAETIDQIWTANGDNSMAFGTVIHSAMENWYKFKDSSCAEKEYNLPKHPILRQIVESFPLKDANVLPEVLLSHVASGFVGRADGIVMIDEKAKRCALIDYKSNADITNDLEKYFKQLEFYAEILIRHGWKVEALGIWNYTTEWTCHKETEWKFVEPNA